MRARGRVRAATRAKRLPAVTRRKLGLILNVSVRDALPATGPRSRSSGTGNGSEWRATAFGHARKCAVGTRVNTGLLAGASGGGGGEVVDGGPADRLGGEMGSHPGTASSGTLASRGAVLACGRAITLRMVAGLDDSTWT